MLPLFTVLSSNSPSFLNDLTTEDPESRLYDGQESPSVTELYPQRSHFALDVN
ncbi:unnamed protein product [Protopolystoma xenopodis]|uniref:Uncharacterized protein n=1 Tax=Protopolystoma xenopodis TaxID=117903 RepID=A0A3S5AL82_9PLAT|nr:unnamed protein product [Protopolystoma xenopodis]